ncbi:MAG TPA: hypothetical protein VGI90_17135 [Steroidobacteraceae bacterium]|jgi:hypothetical protein
MKLGKLSLVASILAFALSLQPIAALATKVPGVTVTGQITASPSSTQIEIAHTLYPIQPNSPAASVARSFFLGQTVDALLSDPGAGGQPEVIALTAHVGQ